jgi:hypothetical protein
MKGSARTGVCFALAATAAAAQACQTGGTDQPAGVSGRWAMFAFEDGVTVELHEVDGAIDGRGCCGGLDDQSVELGCCGTVHGQIMGRQASFGFSFGSGSSDLYDYSTEVFVSADRKRMAGTFRRSGWPVAWVPIGAFETRISETNYALKEILAARAATYHLALANDPAPGGDFSAQQGYHLSIGIDTLFGELGSFWGGEIAWHAADQTMTVGPVPETKPGLPVALKMQFADLTLTSVEATMASGTRYQFQASVFQP